MNRHSIFFKITIFFILMIMVTHLIIYLGYSVTKAEYIDVYVSNFMKTVHKIRRKEFEKHNPQFLIKPLNSDNIKKGFPPPPPPKPLEVNYEGFNKELALYNYEISDIDFNELNSFANLLSKDDKFRLYEYKGFKYFYMLLPMNEGYIVIKDTIKYVDKTQYLIFLTILLNIIFVSFYIFLILKLKPLNVLKENIKLFANGNLDINTSCSGKDEICELSNQFDITIKKIKELRESRNLFLRNIMHELKTPITKCKIIVDLMDENRYQQNLRRAFFRLEFLINELGQVERFTSGNFYLDFKNYTINELVDEAINLLMIDYDEIDLEVNYEILIVDFELFSIVIKNLIDNALKYSDEKPKVQLKDNRLSFISSGNELKKPLNEYLKPFNRDYEVSAGGLGLGLYIVDTILKSHKFSFEYKYLDGKNIFSINFD